MEIIDLIKSTILPIIDVILVAVMLYYAYKLVRGTAAIIVFRGFVIIYIIWWITDVLNMNILSSILGGFIGVGVFAVIIVFQQEIRNFYFCWVRQELQIINLCGKSLLYFSKSVRNKLNSTSMNL